MKRVINTSFKIVGMLVILFLCGCEKEELPPCNKVVQGEFVEVK
jgi:hypothetical protein|nr:hypothetical protein [uncultured Flavobacterium sp.]